MLLPENIRNIIRRNTLKDRCGFLIKGNLINLRQIITATKSLNHEIAQKALLQNAATW